MTNPHGESQAFFNDLLRVMQEAARKVLLEYHPDLTKATGILPGNNLPSGGPSGTGYPPTPQIHTFIIDFEDAVTDIVGELGGFTDPTTDPGDIIIRDDIAATRLGIGDAAQVLTVIAGLPAWADPMGSGDAYFVEYQQTVSQSFSSGVETRINYDSLVTDPDSLVSSPSSAWEYACPIDGIYDLRAGMQTNGGSWYMFAWHNGARKRTMTYSDSGTEAGHCLINASAGDTLHVRLYVTSGGVSSQIYAEHVWIVVYVRA